MAGLKDFFVREVIKDKLRKGHPKRGIPNMYQVLDATGAENIKIFISNGVSFWEALPNESKQEILVLLRENSVKYNLKEVHQDMVVDCIMTVIREDLPGYSFIPRGWIEQTLKEVVDAI
jgi:hypothetical protein